MASLSVAGRCVSRGQKVNLITSVIQSEDETGAQHRFSLGFAYAKNPVVLPFRMLGPLPETIETKLSKV
jgi:hypothetical protein